MVSHAFLLALLCYIQIYFGGDDGKYVDLQTFQEL